MVLGQQIGSKHINTNFHIQHSARNFLRKIASLILCFEIGKQAFKSGEYSGCGTNSLILAIIQLY